MTIATRNRFIRLAAGIALTLSATAVVLIIMILVQKRLPAGMPGMRQLPFVDGFFLTPYSARASIAAIGIFPIFSLAGLLYILFAFEKTQTIEITFFAACLFSVSAETFRLFIPYYQLWQNAEFLSVTISRAVLISRIFMLIALLSSGIFTTGQTVQQVGPSIFLLAFFSFSLSKAVPFNSGNLASNFFIAPGYGKMVMIIIIMMGVLAVLSYLIPGKLRAIPEYRQAAGGMALFLAGYLLLATCDSWAFFAAGSVLSLAGGGLYLDRLHRYYLWQ